MRSRQGAFRFAFVSTMNGTAWGGSEELWSRTALHLAQLGHRVEASVLKWPTRPEPLTRLASAGVAVTYRPRQRALIGRAMGRLLRPFYPGSLEFQDVLWLKKRAPDLVVISQGGPWDGVPWMLACHRMGLLFCPIVQAHSEIWWPLDEELESFRTSYQNARAAVFVSHANRYLLEMQCGIALERAMVVFNPLNLSTRSEVTWPDDTSGTRIACVGRLEPRAKGQDLLFQVLSESKWRERELQLNLYGTGSGEKSLRAMASRLRLANVNFHGHESDLRKVWSMNHALILASRFEGLPLAIIEAMLCARPVITTDVAGNTELVRDEVNGFVAAAPSTRLVDEALERAWGRRQDWHGMGLRARQDALRVVPDDPVAEFASKLLGLVGLEQRTLAGRPMTA